MKKNFLRVFFWGALVFASTSTFVSCKDYDDDIAANTEAIEGLSKALQTQVDQLNAALNAAKAEAEAAHAAYATKTEIASKANQSDLDAYKQACDDAIRALQAEVAAKASVAALESVKAELEAAIASANAVTEAKLQAISAKIDAIDESLNTLTTDIASLKAWKANVEGQVSALQADLANQTQALADLKTWVQNMLESGQVATDAYVSEKLAALNTAISEVNASIAAIQSKLAEAQTEEQVKAIAQSIADEIDAKLSEEINTLNVLVNRVLKSISLVPQLFVGGIEAIEFTSLKYNAIVPGTSGLAANGRSNYVPNDIILIDNGTTEAYYRLNPSIVERTSIDEANIEFLAATAQVRAATVTSPVEFNGIPQDGWNYGGQKGLVKVNLRKTAAFVKKSLNDDGTGKKYIVALKVPRLADEARGVETADIVSENSLLVETEKTPGIARLAWNVNETLPSKGGVANVHHYTDSVTMYNQDVDANQLVYAEVNYNETYDVLAHVTGCFGEHNQITKDELKSYGLTFRFHVAEKEYTKDADHSTNQQTFAAVNEFTGVVNSKLPDGTVNNRACVGKEPIICIQLVDTVNNKLVDERYTKIKWVEETKKPVDLGEFAETSVLKPCDTNIAKGVNWEWIITQAYAKAEVNGLSQATFENVYLSQTPTFGTVTMVWEDGSAASNRTDLLSPSTNPVSPNIQNTTNQQGDAIIAGWTLEPQEIANIYPHQSKTFKCVITFHSILPTEYPDLTMTYVWTITLPTLPSINGYYDNYWFTQYTLHDVMPVQYNTAAYEEIRSGAVVPQGGSLKTYANSDAKYASWMNHNGVEGGYCVYYNNLMNAFTYAQSGNSLIVKDLTSCGKWDMQFTKAGKDYVDESKTYTQFNGDTQYGPILGTGKTSPYLVKSSWKTSPAYRLYDKDNGVAATQALQLVWDETHTEWCVNWDHKKDILYADHFNTANWALINELAAENEADGRTPKRTHEKKVHLGIWGTLNDWNIVHVKDYDICLVAPIRIDAQLEGAFEDGWVSGTAISCDDAFTMTDFRGYEVAKAAPTVANPSEWIKYRHHLYKYYEVGDPEWKLNEVKYGFKYVGGSVKADDSLDYEDAMTSAQVNNYTNGNISLSIDMVNNHLVFKNNGGSNVEEQVNVFIPVSVTYGFGKLTEYVVVRLYPKGTAPSGLVQPAN